MEILTHLINDTIEFYKWTLTIAGENFCSRDLKITAAVLGFSNLNGCVAQTNGWRNGL